MWKKSEVWKNKKFRWLLSLEAVLLIAGIIGMFFGDRIVADQHTMEIALSGGEYLEERQGYYIDGSYGCDGVFLTARPGRLYPGVYRVRITLEADGNIDAGFGVESKSELFRNLLSNPVKIYGGIQEQTCQFYVRGVEDNAVITVSHSGEEPLLIREIALIYTGAGSRIFFCMILVGAVLVNTLVMLYCYVNRYPVPFERKLVWFGVPGTALFASFPLSVDYIILGEESVFHVLRIEALAQSISQGNIPARIEGLWLYGHGYANSIFCSDMFLTLPALMRLAGFDMNVAYNTYVFAVNLATAVIAYLCFKGCFRDSRVGVFGSMLYTLAPYRIYHIYSRGAVEEYTALTFLPLLLYGFYRIFAEDTEQREYKWNWLILTLGFSGLIQSHLLTCEIAGGFAVLLSLILIKKVLRRRTVWELAKAALGTVLLNLWYLVPLWDMTWSGQYCFSGNSGDMIQDRGILPAHIFYTMQAAGKSLSFHEKGLLETEPVGVGMAVLLGVGTFWLVRGLLREERDKRQDKTAVVVFFAGVTALAASTCYFPWDALQSWNAVTGRMVSRLQSPTRLMAVAVVCMTFVACAGAAVLLNYRERFWRNAFFVTVCGMAVIFSLYQTNDILMQGDRVLRLYTVENMGHVSIMGGEYLPEGAVADFSYHAAVPSDGVEVVSFEKRDLDTVTQLNVAQETGEYWVELPMLLYKGYRAQDLETGEYFQVQAGENQVVRVQLPSGYHGTLRVWYAGMWYWRVAEFISLTAFAVLVCISLRRRKKGCQKR